jgi:Family of unknown function (DUF6941)
MLHFNCIVVCDEIRTENTGKDILIGVFSGEILVPSFPTIIGVAFWCEVENSEEDIGIKEWELRVGVENGQPLPFKVTADIRAAGTSTLKIPTVRIPITDRTVISLELLEGENWRVLKSKKVLLVGQQATATSN